MTDRERLVQLMKEGYETVPIGGFVYEGIADYLLANGVIVSPCKVGDKIYRTSGVGDDYCYWEIVKFEIYEDESGFVDDSDNWCSFEDIGKTVFLTREEAEQALAERQDKK